jgi:RNA polymerase sigma factor (TIGR02999 family)
VTVTGDTSEINLLLERCRSGETDAFEQLMSVVYEDLKRIAAWQLQTERPNHTLQPTALVHEVYLRLAANVQIDWKDKTHFFALVAQIMRHILVDHARGRSRDKRGGGARAVALDEALKVSSGASDPGLVELDEALSSLALIDERKSRIVELRYFGGLSIEETSEILKVSPTTVRREWTMAKAWLRRELQRSSPPRFG